jgi:hypothetical protein
MASLKAYFGEAKVAQDVIFKYVKTLLIVQVTS